MNGLIKEVNGLLENGGFEYAFCGGQALDLFLGYESRTHGDVDVCAYWDDRDRIIRHMQSLGFEVYEMLGGGRAHHITDINSQIRKKKNIFCYRDGCPLVKTYPPDEDGCCWMEFFHTGQTRPDFVEFLFNDKTKEAFEYARNREITLPMEKAVLFQEGLPYLAPELCVLYKSTDTEREGYRQDFELAWQAMDPDRREWLRKALLREYPGGHPWLDTLKTEDLIRHFVNENDLVEIARIWPSDHHPLSGEEARGTVDSLRGNYGRNTRGRIFHLCLAVCRAEDPGTFIGWCGLDGSRNPEEPEIFILLEEEYRNRGYGTQCVRELLRTAAEEYSVQSVHGGCAIR